MDLDVMRGSLTSIPRRNEIDSPRERNSNQFDNISKPNKI